MEGRAWQPYRWEVTNMVKAGSKRFGSGSAHDGEWRRGAPSGLGRTANGSGWSTSCGRRRCPQVAAVAEGKAQQALRFNDTIVWDGLKLDEEISANQPGAMRPRSASGEEPLRRRFRACWGRFGWWRVSAGSMVARPMRRTPCPRAEPESAARSRAGCTLGVVPVRDRHFRLKWVILI